MKQKKKLSDIYKERFKDLEIAPPEDAWGNIAASLPTEKRKRTLLPLWYKIAGAAAVLALLFGLFNDAFKINEKIDIPQNTASPSVSVPEESGTKLQDPELVLNNQDEIRNSDSPSNSKNNIPTVQEKTFKRTAIKEKTPVALSEDKTPNPRIKNNATLAHTIPDVSEELDSSLSGNSKEVIAETEISQILLEENSHKKYAEEGAENLPLSNRFSITPTAAIIYFDNIGSGNSVDGQFANNAGRGEITMAYGINIAYTVSEKLKIRTGFSQIELGHKTGGISLAMLSNIRSINNDNKEIKTTLASPSNGQLHQQINYIEVPMEVEYAIIQRKIGVNLIGGVSTLFLDGNNLYLNSPFSRTELGEAKNINDVSFSTNIGLGLDYEILPQFRLKLEPIFKYQINTFDNISGFNPYYFGIYSGISYKF